MGSIDKLNSRIIATHGTDIRISYDNGEIPAVRALVNLPASLADVGRGQIVVTEAHVVVLKETAHQIAELKNPKTTIEDTIYSLGQQQPDGLGLVRVNMVKVSDNTADGEQPFGY